MEKRLQSQRWQTPISHKRATVVTVHNRCPSKYRGQQPVCLFEFATIAYPAEPSDCRCQYQ